MVIKTEKGMYKVEKNYRDAFQLEAFVDKYIEECFDKYPYIVGDISAGILRIKGFDSDPKSENYYGFIEDYLELSCAFGCPFYVLKRIQNEQEFAKLEAKNEPVDTEGGMKITPIEKENFDKETLVLASTPKERKRNVDVNSLQVNIMPKTNVSAEVQEFIKADKSSLNDKPVKKVESPKVEETTASYVSASPDFDPSKMPQNRFNRNNNRNNQNKNNNGNNNQNKPKENKPNNQNKNNNNNQNKPNNNPNANKQNSNNNQNGNKNHNKHKNKKHGNNNQNASKEQNA